MRKIILIALSFGLITTLLAQVKPAAKPVVKKPVTATKAAPVSKEKLVEIKTDYGTMVVKLSDSAPLHRDNFIKLVKEGFYDSLLFHRVIQGFMIQGGDPQSKNADSGVALGMGDAPGGMIPAEFNTGLYHKKGALAMARTDNPEKASSNCQFYIVEGKPAGNDFLNQVECSVRQGGNAGFYYNDAQRKMYNTVGGTPFLDQNYTVFGEVIKGLEVIDKIAAVAKDDNYRPLKDIRMKMRMLN
ncbi:peptidylprolyl isomerase [Parafilimonas sp.]|uniref:peptidylprolyl isomerase n=1 Tax=Parafilimonas sp. TaxID=1969739 RepID=UPI0039E561A7